MLLSSVYFEFNWHVLDCFLTIRRELIQSGAIGVIIRAWRCGNFNLNDLDRF